MPTSAQPAMMATSTPMDWRERRRIDAEQREAEAKEQAAAQARELEALRRQQDAATVASTAIGADQPEDSVLSDTSRRAREEAELRAAAKVAQTAAATARLVKEAAAEQGLEAYMARVREQRGHPSPRVAPVEAAYNESWESQSEPLELSVGGVSGPSEPGSTTHTQDDHESSGEIIAESIVEELSGAEISDASEGNMW